MPCKGLCLLDFSGCKTLRGKPVGESHLAGAALQAPALGGLTSRSPPLATTRAPHPLGCDREGAGVNPPQISPEKKKTGASRICRPETAKPFFDMPSNCSVRSPHVSATMVAMG